MATGMCSSFKGIWFEIYRHPQFITCLTDLYNSAEIKVNLQKTDSNTNKS